MDASCTTERALARSFRAEIGGTLFSRVGDATLALVALAACVVWMRRASGALVDPLPAGALVATGGVIALAAVMFRAARPVAGNAKGRAAYLPWLLASAVAILAAAGLSIGATSLQGLIGLWGLVALEEASGWRRLLSKPRPPEMSASPNRVVSEARSAEGSVTIDDGVAVDQDGVSQYVVRRRTEEGEVLEGWLHVEFAPAQRHASAHLAICPPLARTPQCFAEAGEGPAAQVKVAQVLPYGVRFDVKLDEPAHERESVTIEFSVQEKSADR